MLVHFNYRFEKLPFDQSCSVGIIEKTTLSYAQILLYVLQICSSHSAMKTSKPSLQTSAQEECGVWLDTVQLKGRAKQVIVETLFNI